MYIVLMQFLHIPTGTRGKVERKHVKNYMQTASLYQQERVTNDIFFSVVHHLQLDSNTHWSTLASALRASALPTTLMVIIVMLIRSP